MLMRILRAEGIKFRRAPVWAAFLLLPVLPAVLGTGNYLANLGVLPNQWYSLWTQHTLFSSYFFLPALLGVFCSWEWYLEHSGHNMHALLSFPAPPWALCLGKLLPALGISFLSQAVTGGLFLLSGSLIGLTDPVPPELPEWLVCGALGGMAVCAVQLSMSLLLRSFAVPVALALLGSIAGLMLTAQGLGLYFPYSLLALGMRANNPSMELDIRVLVVSSLVYTLLFTLLSIRLLSGWDAPAE